MWKFVIEHDIKTMINQLVHNVTEYLGTNKKTTEVTSRMSE